MVEAAPGSPGPGSVLVRDAADDDGTPAWAKKLQHHRTELPGATGDGSESSSESEEDTLQPLPKARVKKFVDHGDAALAAQQAANGGAGGGLAKRRGSIMQSASQLTANLELQMGQKRRRESMKKRQRRMSLQQQFATDSNKDDIVITDLLLPGSKTRTWWEMFLAAWVLVQFVLSPFVASFLLFP